MKKLLPTLFISCIILCPIIAYSQMSDSLFGNKKVNKIEKKEKKTKKDKKIELLKINSSKKNSKTSEKEDSKKNDSTSIIPEKTEKTFRYRDFILNSDISTQWLKDSLCKKSKMIVTDMNWYETGDDVRFIDPTDLDVTLQFLKDTTRLTTIQIGDIENMSIVQQLQKLVMKQMGKPTMGYEMIRNFDGDDNTIWSDYTSYEFIYRYDIGNTTFDFRITQYGAKMKAGKVIHPYDFIATVSKHNEAPLSPTEAAAIDINNENKETVTADGGTNTVVKSYDKKRKKGDYYPKEGVENIGDYTIETKILKKW